MQNVKRQVLYLQFVWRLMSQGFINGMISLREISNLKVVISVVIGLSRRKMDTQLTTCGSCWWPWYANFTRYPWGWPYCQYTKTTHGLWGSWLGSSWVWTHDPYHQFWTGKKLSKRDTNTLQFIEDTVRRATFQKQSLTSSLFLVGTQVVKMKSSLVKNWLTSLMNTVWASRQQLLTKRKWTGWANEYIKNADFENNLCNGETILGRSWSFDR